MLNKNKFKKVSTMGIILICIASGLFVFYKFCIESNYLASKVPNIDYLYNKDNKSEKETRNLELGKDNIDADNKQEILKRANRQLSTVKNAVKSSEGKLIISNIQEVVNKMIKDSNYEYQAEVNVIKAQYEELPSSVKDNIKEAIILNMDMTMLKQIGSSFRH